MCAQDGCKARARKQGGFCKSHGGGVRCEVEGCKTAAVEGGIPRCRVHGGGRRCAESGCSTAAAGSTDYCIAHGGGVRCEVEGCRASAVKGTALCTKHGGGNICEVENCQKLARGAGVRCTEHGGGYKCKIDGCTNDARDGTRRCAQHGGGRRCSFEGGCERLARGDTDHCVRHGGGQRCVRADAHVLDELPPHAPYEGKLCWSCFVALHPEKAHSKVRKEHLVLAELERLCPDVFEQATRREWDCPVEGGCSLKRPDLLLDFGIHAVVVEVDELQHATMPCWDEDTRVAVIAADLQVPLCVLRLRVDDPVPCFTQKRLKNGEQIVRARSPAFELLTQRAADELQALALAVCQPCCGNGGGGKSEDDDEPQIIVVDAFSANPLTQKKTDLSAEATLSEPSIGCSRRAGTSNNSSGSSSSSSRAA